MAQLFAHTSTLRTFRCTNSPYLHQYRRRCHSASLVGWRCPSASCQGGLDYSCHVNPCSSAYCHAFNPVGLSFHRRHRSPASCCCTAGLSQDSASVHQRLANTFLPLDFSHTATLRSPRSSVDPIAYRRLCSYRRLPGACGSARRPRGGHPREGHGVLVCRAR